MRDQQASESKLYMVYAELIYNFQWWSTNQNQRTLIQILSSIFYIIQKWWFSQTI